MSSLYTGVIVRKTLRILTYVYKDLFTLSKPRLFKQGICVRLLNLDEKIVCFVAIKIHNPMGIINRNSLFLFVWEPNEI